MDYNEELRMNDLVSRMRGNRLQQRFVSLVWTNSYHEILSARLPELMDNLDEMDPENLNALVRLLDRDGYRNSEIATKAYTLVMRNSSDGKVYRWTEMMERHFDRLLLDEHQHGLSVRLLMTVIEMMHHYDRGITGRLTPEQEWSLLTVTASGMDGSIAAVRGELSGRGRWIRDVELIQYIINNTDMTMEIIAVMKEYKLVRPAQIESFLMGDHVALLNGAL